GTTPVDLSAVDHAAPIVVQLSEPLSADGVNSLGAAAVTAVDDTTGETLAPQVAFDGVSRFTIEPTTSWTHGHAFTLTLAGGLVDLVGHPLGEGVQVKFTVEAGRFAPPVAISEHDPAWSEAIGD